MKFKSYISESNEFFTTLEEVEEWLKIEGIHIMDYEIDDKLIIDVDNNVIIKGRGKRINGHLPVRFGNVDGSFDIQSYSLKSLMGCPDTVGEHFVCSNNPGLTTLEHCPNFVGGNFICNDTVSTLHNIHKYVETIEGIFYAKVPQQRAGKVIQDSLLGLLLINELESLNGGITLNTSPSKTREAFKIINGHLPNNKGKEGVFICQDRLINAGLEEFAKL